MGKRGPKKQAPNVTGGSQASITLREESGGKKKMTTNTKLNLKVQHMKSLAVWASSDVSIPSLAAFFGNRLAACGEATGIPPDPSLFSCQRCESILQPGHNCTVRIEKNRAKVRHRRKKMNNLTQNNVIYKCHFCSHRNLMRGTPGGHMKDICPKAKPSLKSGSANPTFQKSVSSEKAMRSNVEMNKMEEVALPAIPGDNPVSSSPATPLVKPVTTLLEGRARKRNRSGVKKPAAYESSPAAKDAEIAVSTSSKRKRKSWTSLKEIARSSERDNSRNLTNIPIPFFI
ncbi:uncharacterized protein LOC132307916 [Cornus florida]|uniref:uncharacterized protein LOC132307916 n=1 Tax=Cornus florida TaxID=4283 RepID=UPI0028A15922|nr:uncharacterized protein LOC132307916 [Cornus florida]XP_059661788.1 uncharacterized protein LOC132307916 [Cornus florida]XP_059661789.1 uncharacterized protein LOC132307916 [Cornus florida]